MKILALQSKYNSHCCDTIICEDDKVDAVIAEKGDKYNITVNDWFGWVLFIWLLLQVIINLK